MANAVYIFADEMVVEVHREITYHLTADGRYFVELGEPFVSIDRDDTAEMSPELSAILDELLATAREGQPSALQLSLFPQPSSEEDPQ